MTRHLHAVPDRHDTWECPRCHRKVPSGYQVTEHRLNHDLTDLTEHYPRLESLKEHCRLRPSRSGGGVGTPINLALLEFIDGRYEVANGTDEPDIEDGFKESVIAMERAVCAVRGFTFRHRRRQQGYLGIGVDGRVLDALAFISAQVHPVAKDHEPVADELRYISHRLIRRAELLLYGSTFSATWSPCPFCTESGPSGMGTVVADDTRAYCVSPDCRDSQGGRHCWSFEADSGEWVLVPEPETTERGGSLRKLDEQTEWMLTVAAQTGTEA